jgi:hypothetical protein
MVSVGSDIQPVPPQWCLEALCSPEAGPGPPGGHPGGCGLLPSLVRTLSLPYHEPVGPVGLYFPALG